MTAPMPTDPVKAGARYEFKGYTVSVIVQSIEGDTMLLDAYEIMSTKGGAMGLPGVYEERDETLGEWLMTVEVSPANIGAVYEVVYALHDKVMATYPSPN